LTGCEQDAESSTISNPLRGLHLGMDASQKPRLHRLTLYTSFSVTDIAILGLFEADSERALRNPESGAKMAGKIEWRSVELLPSPS
jgi:hypothetical protein